MFLLRRRAAQPPAPVARPTALEYYGATMLPDLSGWWVYALGHRDGGHVFYAGQSDHLLSRLRDHSYTFKEQFDPARVYLIPARDQAEADVVELELIRFYDPECNTAGRRDELARRLRSQQKPGRFGGPLDPRRSLDSKQAAL